MDAQFLNEYYIKGYLANRLNDEEKLAFEKAMNESPMLKDVIEGLRPLSQLEIDLHIKELQKALFKQVDKKQKKKKAGFDGNGIMWIVLVAFILLLILVVSYFFFFTL